MSDDKTMERVRALLTQAEHPNTSQAEAEAFTAKAAELMAKYGIDQALLGERAETRESPTSVRIGMDAPYTREKATLLSAVARSFRCSPVQTSYGQTINHVTVFGFPADLERVQVLYTSLLLQATRDVMRTPVPYYEKTAPFRRTWLVGFATAVGTRLSAAEKRAQQDAETQQSENEGSRSVALVLADRSTLVDAAVTAAFPKLKPARRRQLSGGGMREGYAAGQRADIGSARVGSSGRRGIGGASS
jgi:hypothetical protein